MNGDDHVRVIAREEIKDAMKDVVYTDTCEKCQKGSDSAIDALSKRLDTVDGRLWGIIVMAIVQLCGVIGLFVKLNGGAH